MALKKRSERLLERGRCLFAAAGQGCASPKKRREL
ncbi:hypothetical protein CLOLEP_02832 [[Clostridium] leptum DSM 753]|uniref:Uncharacterized protein n=1 Tax=[Clostridium] leptum DSM 753 TaxID=428125 RepID=A7VW68_9FIRM|nr:hypothetical protein CLOLEP_02832 [[Clostridium] leptum DSM 753]